MLTIDYGSNHRHNQHFLLLSTDCNLQLSCVVLSQPILHPPKHGSQSCRRRVFGYPLLIYGCREYAYKCEAYLQNFINDFALPLNQVLLLACRNLQVVFTFCFAKFRGTPKQFTGPHISPLYASLHLLVDRIDSNFYCNIRQTAIRVLAYASEEGPLFRIREHPLTTDECRWAAIIYRYAPQNDVSVNDGQHIRRWSHKIMI